MIQIEVTDQTDGVFVCYYLGRNKTPCVIEVYANTEEDAMLLCKAMANDRNWQAYTVY